MTSIAKSRSGMASVALVAISVSTWATAATTAARAESAPPEISDYCKNKAMPELLSCGKECTAAFGNPLGSELGNKCQSKCFARADAETKACIPEAARVLSGEFLRGDSPKIGDYCARIYGEARTTRIGMGFPSVMADESYDKEVAKCIATVKKRSQQERHAKPPPGRMSDALESRRDATKTAASWLDSYEPDPDRRTGKAAGER